MTDDKSGVWEIGENSGVNAMADENPVNDYAQTILDRWSLSGTNEATEHRSPIKVPEGLIKSPSGGLDGSKHLPWDKNSLPVPVPFRQGLLALHHGSDCGIDVDAIKSCVA